jgi:hypothetical protein
MISIKKNNIFDDFDILKTLGAGAFGEVKLA